jgi:hypothetical protein
MTQHLRLSAAISELWRVFRWTSGSGWSLGNLEMIGTDYIVCGTIHGTGFLDQHCVPERCLRPPPSNVPEELEFLHICSRVLKGTASLPSNLQQRILDRKVYIRKTLRFGFASYDRV